jgi:hypothetical protein
MSIRKQNNVQAPTYLALLSELVGTLESMCSCPILTPDLRDKMASRLETLKAITPKDINLYKIYNELKALNGIKE